MADGKNWVEVILMPLVVALVGVLGTCTITRQQADNALTLSRAQLESAQEQAQADRQIAREQAREDRQIKIVDIFFEKITSSEEADRLLALRLLEAIDGEFAEELASAVADSEPEDSNIKRVADQVAVEAAERAKSALSARVYFHIRSEDVRQHAHKIAEELENNQIVVPGLERLVDVGPSDTQLRYFRKSEQSQAERIGDLLHDLGVEVNVVYVQGFEQSTAIRDLHFELWFAPGEPVGPGERP